MRFEYKYIVHESLMEKLRQAVLPFVEPDKFMDAGGKGHYTVRSIYFDSPRFDYYFEKIDGIRDRIKMRLRGYEGLSDDAKVFFEIKRKYNIPIAKDRTCLTYSEALIILKNLNKTVYHEGHEDVRSFVYHLLNNRLVPVVNVIYEREAYLDKFYPGNRITIDRNLRSVAFPSIDRLYSENGVRRSLSGYFILEVKFNRSFPQWMKPIQSSFGLLKQSASKYAICVSKQNITNSPNKSFVLVRSKWFSNQLT
ncbi:MAG: polyphosphate polymerase domain-containing protein [Bacteroidales bacterium]|nr:polyphosphate polymerase domain-containing protein [Bacteroidales bacterium]